MFPIYAIPTLNYLPIPRPELTLFINGNETSSMEITRIIQNSFCRMVEEGTVHADGFEMFTYGAEKGKIIIGSESLSTADPIDRDVEIPFLCDRYMGIDATALEQLASQFKTNSTLISPMSAYFNGYDFNSIPDFMEYTTKSRTVIAWKELLEQSSANIMGEYSVLKTIKDQLPEVTRENFKTIELLPFTFDNLFQYFNDLFLFNFMPHLVQPKVIGMMDQFESKDTRGLFIYPDIYSSGQLNNDLLNLACSNLKLCLQLVESRYKVGTPINQAVVKLHHEFFEALNGSIDVLNVRGPVLIFNGDVEINVNQNALEINLKNDFYRHTMEVCSQHAA